MASVGAALAGMRFKPGKIDNFGYFESEIQLDTLIARPFGSVGGRFVVYATNEIKCHGIRVQLDAIVSLKFETKFDNRLSTHKTIESLLEGASKPGFGYYISSPVGVQINGNEDDNSVLITLQPGTHTFPFVISIPGEPLPAAFTSHYGYLNYKISAYMKSTWPYYYVHVAERQVRFRGYNNLSEHPNALTPIRHEAGFTKSFFSSKKDIISVLTVDKTGFLPGEELRFKLQILNPKSWEIRRVNVTFLRKITYNVNDAIKSTTTTLDKFEVDEMTMEENVAWIAKLNIPKNCIPSYNVKPTYSVLHFLQYQVKVLDYPVALKGNVEIIIGTTREPIAILMSRRMSQLQVDEPSPLGPGPGIRERSDSMSSRLSDSSLMTTASRPPAYSNLSSRAMSLISLDTLPPHYDDLPCNL